MEITVYYYFCGGWEETTAYYYFCGGWETTVVAPFCGDGFLLFSFDLGYYTICAGCVFARVYTLYSGYY